MLFCDKNKPVKAYRQAENIINNISIVELYIISSVLLINPRCELMFNPFKLQLMPRALAHNIQIFHSSLDSFNFACEYL